MARPASQPRLRGAVGISFWPALPGLARNEEDLAALGLRGGLEPKPFQIFRVVSEELFPQHECGIGIGRCLVELGAGEPELGEAIVAEGAFNFPQRSQRLGGAVFLCDGQTTLESRLRGRSVAPCAGEIAGTD